MKKIFLISALSLASLSSLSCLAHTASLNQYDLIHCAPVTTDRTVTEYKNESAFTVLLDNGQLFSWGKTQLWGDENIVAPAIPDGKSVKEIFSSTAAFAALLDDGTILCWGDSRTGGTAPFVAPQRQVISIASNYRGFVAILDNGTVVTWGALDLPQSLLDAEVQGKHVVSVTSSNGAFAAVVVDPITSQQTMISWGGHSGFRPSNELYATLEIPVGTKVTSIAANRGAFAALLDNGTVQAWGDKSFGGIAPPFRSDKKIISLVTTDFAFTVLFADGTIQSWGDQQKGGKTPTLPAGSIVTKIFATECDFAALLSGSDNHGYILSWGTFSTGTFSTGGISGGDSKIIIPTKTFCSWSKCQRVLSVKSVIANTVSFAAILNDGSVIAWGFSDHGGATPSLPAGKKVVSITPCSDSFTALFVDGTIQSWGCRYGGKKWIDFDGKTPTNIPAARRVVSLTSNYNTYMALLDDGSLFSWGGDGNSACVDGQLISLPEGTKALWMASPFEKYVLKTSSSE